MNHIPLILLTITSLVFSSCCVVKPNTCFNNLAEQALNNRQDGTPTFLVEDLINIAINQDTQYSNTKIKSNITKLIAKLNKNNFRDPCPGDTCMFCCPTPDCMPGTCQGDIFAMDTDRILTEFNVYTNNNSSPYKATINRIPNTATGVTVEKLELNTSSIDYFEMVLKDKTRYIFKST